MAKCLFDLAEDDVLTTAQKDLIKAVPGLSDNGRVATMLSLHKFSSKSCIIQYNLEWWRPVIQRIEKLFDDECQQSGIVCCAFSKNSKSNDKHRTLKLTDCLTKTVDCVCKCLRFLRHLLLRSYNKDVVSSKSVDYLNSFLRSVDDRLADEALLTLENLVQEQPARVDINYGEREMVETAAHNNPELQKSLCQIIQGWSFGTMKNALLGCKIMDADLDFRFLSDSGLKVCSLSDDMITAKTTYLSVTAAQRKFNIPEKHLASLLVVIRYCRDLRQRASALKAIRRRLVAFQVLLSTTASSAPCVHRLILRHFGILNETVEVIKTPLGIPSNVQQAGLGLLNALVTWCGQTSTTGSFEFLSAKLGVTAALGLSRTHHHSGVMSTIVRTTLSLVPSLVSGCTYNASTTVKLRQHGFAASEDEELAIGLLFVEALKQVSSNSHSDSQKHSLLWVESVLALSNSVARTKRGPALFVDSGLFPCVLEVLGATKRPTEAMFTQYYSLLTQLVELMDTVLQSTANLVAFLDMKGFDVIVQILCREVADMFPHTEDYDLLPFDEMVPLSIPLSNEALQNRNFGTQILVRSLFELASSIILRSSTLNCTRFFEQQMDTNEPGKTVATPPLVQCISSIFDRSTEVHPLIFSLNAKLLTNIINQNPASVSIIYESGVGEAFLRTIRKQRIPKNPAIYASIPIHLRALGLSKSTESRVLKSPCPILATLRLFLQERNPKNAVSTSKNLGKALEELMHHSEKFKVHVVDAVVNVFKDFFSTWSKMPVPMVWLSFLRPLKYLCKIVVSILSSESHAKLFVKTELVPLLFDKIPRFLSKRRHPMFLNASTWQKFPVTVVIQMIGRSPSLLPQLFVLMNKHVEAVLDLPLLIDHKHSNELERLNQNVHNAIEKYQRHADDGERKKELLKVVQMQKSLLKKFLQQKKLHKTFAAGWEKIYSTKHEKYYFFNHISKVSRWDAPPGVCADTINSSTAAVLGWQLHTLGLLVRSKLPRKWKVELARVQASHPEVLLDLIKNMNSLRCRFRQSYAESLLAVDNADISKRATTDSLDADALGTIETSGADTNPEAACVGSIVSLAEPADATNAGVTKRSTALLAPSAPQHVAPHFLPPEDVKAVAGLQSNRTLTRYEEIKLSDQPRLLTKSELLQFLRCSRRFLSLAVRLTSMCAVAVSTKQGGDTDKLMLHVHKILQAVATTLRDSTNAVAKCSFNESITEEVDLVTLRARMYSSLMKDVLAYLYHKLIPNTMFLILLHRNDVLKDLLGHCFGAVQTAVHLRQQALLVKNLLPKFTRLQKVITTACWLAERVTAYQSLHIKSPLTSVLHRSKPLREAFGLQKFDASTCHQFIQNLHARICHIILPIWSCKALPLLLNHNGIRKFINMTQYMLEVSTVDSVQKKKTASSKKLIEKEMKNAREMANAKTQILAMGYTEARIEQAIAAVGRPDVQRIVLWLLNNAFQQTEEREVSDLELAKQMSLETSSPNALAPPSSLPPKLSLGLTPSELAQARTNFTKLRKRLVGDILRACLCYQSASWTHIKDKQSESNVTETPDVKLPAALIKVVAKADSSSQREVIKDEHNCFTSSNESQNSLVFGVTKESRKDLRSFCRCLIELMYLRVFDTDAVIQEVVRQAHKCVAQLSAPPASLPPVTPLYSVLSLLVALLLSKVTSPIAHFPLMLGLARKLTDLLDQFIRMYQKISPVNHPARSGNRSSSKGKKKQSVTTDAGDAIERPDVPVPVGWEDFVEETDENRPNRSRVSNSIKQNQASVRGDEHASANSEKRCTEQGRPWPLWISASIYVIDLVVTLPVVGAQSAECTRHLKQSARQIEICTALLKHKPRKRVYQAIVALLRRLVCRDDLVARFVELNGVQALVAALNNLLFVSDEAVDERAITFTQYILQRSCRTHQLLVGLLKQRIRTETARRLKELENQERKRRSKKRLTLQMFTKLFKFSIQRSPGAFTEAAIAVVKRCPPANTDSNVAASVTYDAMLKHSIELRTAADRDVSPALLHDDSPQPTTLVRLPVAKIPSQKIAHLVVNVIIETLVTQSSISTMLNQDPSMYFLLSILSHLVVTVPSMKAAFLTARPRLLAAMSSHAHPTKRKRESRTPSVPIKSKRRRERSKHKAQDMPASEKISSSTETNLMFAPDAKLAAKSPDLIRYLIRTFLVERDSVEKSDQKVSQAVHRLLGKVCEPVMRDAVPRKAVDQTRVNYLQRQQLRDTRDRALFSIVLSELKMLLDDKAWKLNIRSYCNIVKVIDTIVALPLTKLRRAIRSRTDKLGVAELTKSLVLQAAYKTEMLSALFNVLGTIGRHESDAMVPDFVKLTVRAAEHLTRQAALTAGAATTTLPSRNLEKGATSHSILKRVNHTPGSVTEAMLMENDIEEAIEGERAEEQSEEEEDEDEDSSEIENELDDVIASDIQRANDQEADDDNDSESDEDAITVEVDQMFDVEFGPQVVEVGQLVSGPTAVDSEEEDDAGDDEVDEDEGEDGEEGEHGNEVQAESDGQLDAEALEEESCSVEDGADSGIDGVDDSFAIPVHMPQRNRVGLDPEEVTSDERPSSAVDTFVRIARLGDTRLSDILGIQSSHGEHGLDGAENDERTEQTREGRAVVLAFTQSGRFRNFRGSRRSNPEIAHPLMQLDADTASSSQSEAGGMHMFDDVTEREGTASETQWHGILAGREVRVSTHGENDDETIATRLSQISPGSTFGSNETSGDGLNAQLRARRQEVKRQLEKVTKVKQDELMWIKWGFPHWIDSSGNFLTCDANALQQRLVDLIPAAFVSDEETSKKPKDTLRRKDSSQKNIALQNGTAVSVGLHSGTSSRSPMAIEAASTSINSSDTDIIASTSASALSSAEVSLESASKAQTTSTRAASTRASSSSAALFAPVRAETTPTPTSGSAAAVANIASHTTVPEQHRRNSPAEASVRGLASDRERRNESSLGAPSHSEEDLTPIICPPHIDRDVFALLPRQLQRDVVNETESVRNAVVGASVSAASDDSRTDANAGGRTPPASTQQFANTNYAADVLRALPSSIRNEVLQAERESRERRVANSNGTNVAENIALLNSVGSEMRRDILLQANSQFLANMPENIVQEARALQRRATLRASHDQRETTARHESSGPGRVTFMRRVNLGNNHHREASFVARVAQAFGRRREAQAVVTRLLPQFLQRVPAGRSNGGTGCTTIRRLDVDSTIIDRLRETDVLSVIYLAPYDCTQWNHYLRLLNNLCWHKGMRARILSLMLLLIKRPFASSFSRASHSDFPPPDLYGAGLDGVHESKPARASRIIFRLLFALGKLIKTNKATRDWFLKPIFSTRYQATFDSAVPNAVDILVGVLGSTYTQGNKLHAQLLITILRAVLRNIQKPLHITPQNTAVESKEDVKELETKQEEEDVPTTASAQKPREASETEPQIMWGFEDVYGRNFIKFSDENNLIIERAYQAGKKHVDIVCKPDKQSVTYRVHFMEGLFLRENLKNHVKRIVLRGFKDVPISISEAKIRCPEALKIFVTAFTLREAEFGSKEQEHVFNVLKSLCLDPDNKLVAFAVLTERILALARECVDALQEQDLEVKNFDKQQANSKTLPETDAGDGVAMTAAKESFALAPKPCDRLLLRSLRGLLFLCRGTGVKMNDTMQAENIELLKLLWHRMGATMSRLWSSFSTPGEPTRDATISNMGARFLHLIDSLFLFHTQLCKSSENLAMFVKSQQILLNCLVRQNKVLLKGPPVFMGYHGLASLVEDRFCRVYLEFDVKRLYFKQQISKRYKQYGNSQPEEVTVRRDHCFEDSFKHLGFAKAKVLRGKITIHFEGEEGVDAGGLTREWYRILARGMFNQDNALFTVSADSPAYQPNQYSRINEAHLHYFKFIGRIIGKALVDGYQFDAYFTRSFYKHMLGLKPTMEDMAAVDPEYYKNLQQILKYDLDDLDLELFFTVRTSFCGQDETHVLKPGGDKIEVTNENKAEYVQLVTQHRMCTAIKDQITAFLEGFHEMVDKDLISIFDETELELLISGLPSIDIEDLRKNTDYVNCTIGSQNIIWFWEVLRAFTEEEQAKFLQFVTGTSKVPLEGFKMLKGMRGITKFNIHKVGGGPKRLPSAHTCFNQLDLPEYETAEQMREKLQLVLSEGTEGFSFA